MNVDLAVAIRQAESAPDFEMVRLIRNAGREWMADTREISLADQERFRETFQYSIWLYSVGSGVVGYGLVKPGRDRYAYVSLAVAPQYRGQGLGRMIYRDLRSRWDDDLWAVCRIDNTPSIRAALSAGYVMTARIVAHDTVALKAGALL